MPLTEMPTEVVNRLRAAELTYPEAGQSAGELPAGYHHLRRARVIGTGAADFARAADRLFRWQAVLGAGISVAASAPVPEPGTVALLGAGAGAARMAFPVRVVYVMDEPTRRGFAVGTLPGHPECGEESFTVIRRPDDRVIFTLTVFSRPARLLTRAAGPAGHLAQWLIAGRYLRAMAS